MSNRNAKNQNFIQKAKLNSKRGIELEFKILYVKRKGTCVCVFYIENFKLHAVVAIS